MGWRCFRLGPLMALLIVGLLSTKVAGGAHHRHAPGKRLHFLDVAVSPNDPRRAAYAVLPNGLRVLLVSDPAGQRAGAAVDVAVGSLDDPEGRQGLAHFLEHMLFLGSKKYPAEDAFKDYLQLRGGSSNAFTDQWHTNFFFSVRADSLEGGLDRLAQFFVAPLLSPSPAAREVEAVNNEHEKNLQDDSWALWQLWKHLADPRHPFHKFSTGSKATLAAPDTVTLLRHFYEKHYTSAAVMRLAVQGRESVEQLGEWAARYFSAVPARPAPPTAPVTLPVWPQTGRRVRVQPFADLRQLHFVWQLPDLLAPYRAMVPQFLSFVFESRAEGSLYHALKAELWAEGVDLDLRFVRDVTLMDITVTVTAQGLEEEDRVAQAVFGFIRLVRDTGLHCSLWHKAWDLEQLHFRFAEAGDVEDFLSAAATGMQYRAPHDVLGSPADFQCDRHLLADVFARLTPANMLLFVVAHTPDQLPDAEPLYGTRYAVRPLSPRELRAWAAARPTRGMALPGANRFLPADFRVGYVPRPSYRPVAVHHRPGLRVWHQYSTAFRQPKALLQCQVHYPRLLRNSTATLLLALYGHLVMDALECPLFPAKQVGLSWGVSAADNSLLVSAGGFSAPLAPLLRAVAAAAAVAGRVGPRRFAAVRAAVGRAKANKRFENGFTYAWRVLRPLVLEQPAASPEQQLAALQQVTLPTFEAFVAALPREPHSVECLALGNVAPAQATTLGRHVAEAFGHRPTPAVDFPRLVRLPEGRDTAIPLPVPNPADPNSVLLSTYQLPAELSPQGGLALELAQFITDPAAFTELRTKEQLGYVVFTVAFSLHALAHNVTQYHVLVQSGEYGPGYLDDRVEAFLGHALKTLQGLGKEDLEAAKQGLLDRKWPRPLSLGDEFDALWREVAARTFHFDRQAAETRLLRGVRAADVAATFRRGVVDRTQRRKVSILVYGKGRPLQPAVGGAKPTAIVEWSAVDRWKADLCPLCGGRRRRAAR